MQIKHRRFFKTNIKKKGKPNSRYICRVGPDNGYPLSVIRRIMLFLLKKIVGKNKKKSNRKKNREKKLRGKYHK